MMMQIFGLVSNKNMFLLIIILVIQLVGHKKDFIPNLKGDSYCGVGSLNVARRDIVDKHLDICIDAGLNIEGTNAEVMLGSWEY